MTPISAYLPAEAAVTNASVTRFTATVALEEEHLSANWEVGGSIPGLIELPTFLPSFGKTLNPTLPRHPLVCECV